MKGAKLGKERAKRTKGEGAEPRVGDILTIDQLGDGLFVIYARMIHKAVSLQLVLKAILPIIGVK